MMVESPVIVGVGEVVDRPADLRTAREPLRLMFDASRVAEADAGVSLLGAVDSLDVINEVSWPYPDATAQLSDLLGMTPRRADYGPVGGQTPVRAIHDAALAIARGEAKIVLICGAEAENSVRRADREQVALSWSPRIEDFRPIRGADFQREVAIRLGLSSPTAVYPLYENATRVAWGQSFDEAQAESGMIWSNNAGVAAGRDAAWLRDGATAEGVRAPGPRNRMIAWPYPKLMTANPEVNQGSAIIMTGVSHARTLGIAADRMVFPWGGGADDEHRDILARADYVRSTAMAYALGRTMALLTANDRIGFDHLELYSCFPCVPKMARRLLGIAADRTLSVAGGLTFFGAPLNNYMTHAAVALVQALRRDPAAVGLLYGQGEYVTKHHALALSATPSRLPLDPDYRRAAPPPDAPPFSEDPDGEAAVETFTVLYDRDGAPRHGVVIARTGTGDRIATRVPASDTATIARLTATAGTPVGAPGRVTVASDGIGEWRAYG